MLLVVVFFASCKKEKEIVKFTIDCESDYLYGYNLDFYNVINDTIKKNETFGAILDRHHVLYPKINEVATKVKDTFDVRRVQVGKPYTILASKDSTEQAKIFIYKHNKVTSTVIDFKDSIVEAHTHKEPIKIIERKISGKILSTFSEAMDTLGIRPNLSYEVADIYAWTVDFYRLRKGDTFKIIFEEKFLDDTVSVGYGKIKAALFNHKGRDLYAYQYVADSIKNIPEYYDDEAGLLRRQFLKSPIKFKYRISSRYNLKRRIKLYGNKIRPHEGTDFAAPIGTPIMSTANGTVVESARRGGNGNYVKVRHNNVYSTQYLHMKRRKVKVGEFVKQGDVIGWIGMTGNTSGPHVCYRFWKNGRQVDPFKQKLPSAKPMLDSLKPAYFEFIKPLRQQLNSIPLPKEEELELDLPKEEEIVAKN